MPTGNRIVDRAIEAHGGEARWRQVSTLRLTWTFRGLMFKLRLREAQLRRLQARINTREPRVEAQDARIDVRRDRVQQRIHVDRIEPELRAQLLQLRPGRREQHPRLHQLVEGTLALAPAGCRRGICRLGGDGPLDPGPQPIDLLLEV